MQQHDVQTHEARVLRQVQTQAQKILWNHLRGSKLDGFKFRRQVPLGGRVVEFYCAEACLVIATDAQSIELDRWQRDAPIPGLQVLTFADHDIVSALPDVLAEISRHAKATGR